MCGGGGGPPPSEKDNAQVEEFNAELERDKEKYKDGPLKEGRGITDCICCLVFIVAIVGFAGASWYGW